MACQLLDLLPGEFRGRQGGPRVLSEAVLVCLRRQKCLLFGEFRMLASHRGLAPTSKEVCSHQMPLWTGAAVGGASHAQFSCKVKSTGLCLTVAARSEASLAPRGSPDAQRGGEVCSWKGLGESPGCPPHPPPPRFVLFRGVSWFCAWLASLHIQAFSAAEGKGLSQFSRCRRHWETNMSPWQPQGYLTQQHSQKRFIFLSGEPASAMSAEPTGLLLVCF